MDQLGSFLNNSRRKVGFVDRLEVKMGKKAVPVPFPKVGYLSRVLLRIVGNLNIAAGGSLGEKGIWHIFDKIGLNVNIQNAEIWNTSGYGAFIEAHRLERGFNPGVEGVFNKQSKAVGDNAIDVILPLQINANHSNDAEAGIIPLHTEGLRTTMDFRFNSDSEIGDGCTFTGEIEIYYEYHEGVNPAQVQEPDLVLIKTIEDVTPIIAAGNQIFQVPQMGVLFSMFHYLTFDEQISEAIEELFIKVGRTETLTSEPYALNRMRHRLNLGSNLPKGVCGYNFFHAHQKVSEGSLREAIDTEEIAELESVVKTLDNVTVGAGGTNYLTTIRRIFQPSVVTS